MQKVLFLCCLLSLTVCGFSQNSINFSEIESEILANTNALRDSAGLDALKNNGILQKAAIDQSDYMKWTKVLGHSQSTYNKQTPSERVFYYKGNFNYIGENVAYVSLKDKNGQIKSNKTLGKQLYTAWLNSPPHKKNLLGEHYFQIGIGLAVDTISNRVYGTQVFSALGYSFPSRLTTPSKAYGVQTFDSVKCNDIKNFRYGTLSLANGIYVKDDSVFIKYHDKNYFNKLIPNPNDGYALDIVFRDQLPCNLPNKFHGSDIFDGYMLEPKFRYELEKSNSSKNPRKIIAYLGKAPKNIKPHEFNLILIRNNRACDYSFPVYTPSDDIPPFQIPPKFIDTAYTFEPINIDTTIELSFSFERGKTTWNENYSFELYNTLYGYAPFISNIQIQTYSSVEGKEWYNIELQEKRSERIKQLISQFINSETVVKEDVKENWPKFEEQIKELSLVQYQGLNEKEVKKKLLSEKENPLIDSLLFEQRIAKATFKISGRIDSITTGINEYLAIKYSPKQYRIALMSHQLFESKGEAIYSVKREIDSSCFVSTNLANNYVAAHVSQKFTGIPKDVPTPNLNKIDITDSVDSYYKLNWLNLYFHELYKLSIRYYYVPEEMDIPIEPEEALTAIQTMEDGGFQDTIMISRLKLNYALSSIHYFAATNQWNKSSHLFEIIFNYFYTANLSIEELTDLALFCNWYHKYNKTVEMLGHAYDENYLDENAAFVLAQTATLIRRELEDETYLNYMQTAYEANPERWCKWLNSNFQVLRDEDVKGMYCKKCL